VGHQRDLRRVPSPDHEGELLVTLTDSDLSELLAALKAGEVTDTIRDAARIPQDRRLAPDNVQRACEYGLGEILQGEGAS
jgi:hypothetical protein